ncbi:MAG: heavy metal translocating P-type ATPase [Chloroflexi bacterium]|nr:MAG: heavy metal translocating P-type ATPase [Chloroflexota bacterium]RLT33606.1 MAG: heavy metal translocating P-type ATPase [Chloroflexota bacterium]
MTDILQTIRALDGVAGARFRDDNRGVIVLCRKDTDRHAVRAICDDNNMALVIESVEVEISPEEAEIANLPQMIRFTVICLIATVLGYVVKYVVGDDQVYYWWPFFIIAMIFGGYDSAIETYHSFRKLTFNIDALMFIGALGATAVGQPAEGALLMFLFSMAGTLETYAMGRTHASIRTLIAMSPREAEVVNANGTRTISVEALVPGDVVFVRPGAQIPADGLVTSGASSVNEASITGESVPVDKKPGTKAFAGTINGEGALHIQVTTDAAQSTLARIVSVVREAREQKARSQDFTDRIIGNYYAKAVAITSLLAIVIGRLVTDEPWGDTIYRAMTLLVVMSPCALVISIPASLLSALAHSARNGVLFKGGKQLEAAATIKVVAFDKTGTLTTGRPGVVAVIPVGGPGRITLDLPQQQRTTGADDALSNMTDDQIRLLVAAAAVEHASEHPLARAIVQGAKERGLTIPEATDFKAVVAAGATAVVAGQRLRVGKPSLFGHVTSDVLFEIEAEQRRGNTTIAVGSEDDIWGLITIADTVRPESKVALQDLHRAGYRIALLTGDNQHVANALAKELGLDDVRAELLPQDKVDAIRDLQRKYGPVAMIGDGINDAPALATADLGIAMGSAGSDVAHESADVVLMKDDLSRLTGALQLAKQARTVIWQNLVFAFIVIAVLVVSTLTPGFDMKMTYGVIGHEGSTLLVVANGLRLLLPMRTDKRIA